MALQKGDYILLDYTIIVKDESKVVQTTSEDIAREAGIYSPDDIYEPRLIVLGETKLLEPVEEALMKADEGQEIEIEVPPEKGFGQRDPNKVKVISIREFYRYGKLPRVGDIVEFENQRARVVSISSGRVVLDFNHPLAGKTLIVKAKIVRKIESDEEKIKHIVKNHLPRIDLDKVQVTLSDDKKIVTIKLPPETLLVDRIGLVKTDLANDLGRRFNLNKVVFIDEIELRRSS